MDLAAWIEHPAEADGREQEGELEGRAEDCCSQIARRNRDALTRAERDVAERAAVRAERDFVLRPSVDVRKDDRRQPPFRQAAEVADVDDARKADRARKAAV